jgi:hypothetical protein
MASPAASWAVFKAIVGEGHLHVHDVVGLGADRIDAPEPDASGHRHQARHEEERRDQLLPDCPAHLASSLSFALPGRSEHEESGRAQAREDREQDERRPHRRTAALPFAGFV